MFLKSSFKFSNFSDVPTRRVWASQLAQHSFVIWNRMTMTMKRQKCMIWKFPDKNRKVAGSFPFGVSGFFIDIKSFRSHYGPGFYSASNRNEYQEYFLVVKAAGA
jgi:hypothetical protein